MSAFSAEWLTLRERADLRARNAELLCKAAALFKDREHVRLLDLGCGAGSNLRAMAPFLPQHQDWRLVDHDDALLAVARTALSAWAEQAQAEGNRLILRKDGRTIAAEFVRADLARDCEQVLAIRADLVTAAALIDLASAAWLQRLADALASDRTPFYTVLAYDGRESWTPPHPQDADMHAAFLAHQTRDKGFGPAAGPRAAQALADAFGRVGYEVQTARSDWVLGDADAPLVRALVEGIAQAVSETGRVPEAVMRAWRAARMAGATCVIGHTDILAMCKN